MNALLERLGAFAARRRWWVIAVWVLVLVGLSVARGAFGGTYVNDYSVPGSESSDGLDALTKDFAAASGYGGQIVFHATTGKVSDHADAVSTSMKNIGGLDHVLSATDPLTTSGTPDVSKDGTIAYGTTSWDVVPASLDSAYLDKMDAAVAPARQAGLTVEYGGGAGQIGQAPDDRVSEVIGLTCALLLLLLMFASLAAALVPLVAAVFSVGSGLAIVGLVAGGTHLPTTAPTVATLLGLGVAIDYGLFLVARHREQLDHGLPLDRSIARTAGTSGAAIVVAGSTVVVAILGLYVSAVPFVGALGLAAAIVVAVTMLSALTLVPALLAVDPRPGPLPQGPPGASGAPGRDRARPREQPVRPVGAEVSNHPWPWGIASTLALLLLAVPLLSLRLGQLDAGTDPTSQSSRRAYDLIDQGFGPGANGPLTVVVTSPRASTRRSCWARCRRRLQGTPGVASVTGRRSARRGTTAMFNVIPKTAPDAAATTTLVDTLRDDVLPSCRRADLRRRHHRRLRRLHRARSARGCCG